MDGLLPIRSVALRPSWQVLNGEHCRDVKVARAQWRFGEVLRR